MADTTHKTKWEWEVDERPLKDLGRLLERALDPSVAEAFENAIERTNRSIQDTTKTVEKLAKTFDEAERKRAQSDRTARAKEEQQQQQQQQQQQKGGLTTRGVLAGTAIGSYVGNKMAGLGQRAAAAAPFREGFVGQAFSGIPGAGPVLSSAVGAAGQYFQQYAGFQQSRASGFGLAGTMDHGAFGKAGITGRSISPMQRQAILQQLAQTSGRSGEGLEEAAPAHIQMQRLLGLNQGGAIVGAGETAGGKVGNAAALMKEAVTAGLESGMRHARLDQFLQQVSSFTEQARTQGIPLAPQSTLQIVQGISRIGSAFKGEAGAKVATDLATGLRGAAEGSDAFSFMAMQAAGYTGGPGGKSLVETIRTLEEKPEEVIPALIARLNRGEGSDDAKAFSLRKGMRSFGTQLSMKQAMQMVQASPDMLRAAGGDPERLEKLMAERQGKARGALATGQFQAGLESQRIVVGGKVAPTVAKIQKTEMDLIQRFLPMAMKVADRLIVDAKQVLAAFDEGGFAEAVKVFFKKIKEGFEEMLFGSEDDPYTARDSKGRPIRGFGDIKRGLEEDWKEMADDPGGALRTLGEGIEQAEGAVMDALGIPKGLQKSISTGAGLKKAGEQIKGAGKGKKGEGAEGPQSSAADAIERARENLGFAAEHLRNQGLPSDDMETGIG